VAIISQTELHARQKYFVVRSERGNALVRRDPRELPRRLRVLLLAIDGGQTVELYTNTLRGFGDVSALLIELYALGLIELHPPGEMYGQPRHSEQYSVLSELFEDSKLDPEAADVLYATTTSGSFEDMVRVAKLESPEYIELPAPPAPITPEAQKAQVESLFSLLEKVRGERRSLKHQVAKMDKLRQASLKVHAQNNRLRVALFALATLCIALLVLLAIEMSKR
jgi:hypothetical protein